MFSKDAVAITDGAIFTSLVVIKESEAATAHTKK
jgi:hypothetical protein